jgi:hypothetical protein
MQDDLVASALLRTIQGRIGPRNSFLDGYVGCHFCDTERDG